jgi:hypothetical protein
MTDFHHNVFYFYRGAKEAEPDRERQLENNTTKALINTLEHGGKEVQIAFLKWLELNPCGEVKLKLQKKTIGDEKIHRKSQRLLLGITPLESDKLLSDPCTHDDSLPDAWIYGDNFVVLVESKVVGCLSEDQMERHLRKLNTDPHHPPRQMNLTWAMIHHFFSGLPPKQEGEKKWIVDQFTQYLEYTNMADFIGFKGEMFDFFFTTDDEEIRVWVRDTLGSFGKKVLTDLKQIDSFYQDCEVGTLHLKNNHAWVAFGPSSPKYRNYAHQTIAINAQGIDVFVNVELKSASDRLKDRIHQDGQSFRKLLSELESDPSLCIQIEERIQRQASLHDNHPVANIQIRYINNPTVGAEGFDYLQKIIEKIHLPSMAIKRHIPRKQVLALSQKDQGLSLIKEVVSIMKGFHPLVSYINGPV